MMHRKKENGKEKYNKCETLSLILEFDINIYKKFLLFSEKHALLMSNNILKILWLTGLNKAFF